MKKGTRVFLNLYFLLSVFVTAAAVYIYIVGRSYFCVKKSELLGNNPDNIERLKKTEGEGSFSFAFISDTENSDPAEWLIKNLLKEKIDFLVFNGDFVNEPVFAEHKYFIYTILRNNPRIPIFLVPANHDIDTAGRKTPGFGKADFETLYGPVNFSFIYNNCLFVFLSNIAQDDKLCSDYLEKVLSRRSENIKHTFIFSATPLRKVLHKVFSVPLWISDLDKIVENYGVDYIISGDYHRHVELDAGNGIQYIVSGSGGSHYAGETKFGQFRSAAKMTVYPDCITRELLVYDKPRLTDNSIKHFIYNKVMPSIESKFWVIKIILAVLAVNFIISVHLVFKR